MREGFLHRHSGGLSRLLRVIDVALPVTLFWVIPDWSTTPLQPEWLLMTMYLVGILSAIIFHFGGLYETYRQRSLLALLTQLTVRWLMVLGALLFVAFATKVTNYLSRSDLILWAVLAWISLIGVHVGSQLLLRLYRRRGGNTRSVLFWGSPESATRIYHEFQAQPHLGLCLQAWFSPQAVDSRLLPAGMPRCSGGLEELEPWLKRNDIDLIFFSHASPETASAQKLLDIFGDTCKPVHYIPEWAHPSMCFQVDQLGGTFCIGLWGRKPPSLDLQVKRLFDICVSLALITALSPLLLAITLLIKITSPGPVFFRQDRYGIDGRRFKILKFRTMRVVERGDKPGLRQASRNDPRVTPLGRILRRWSLDELPQLFNVLAGSMSLVGPRPHAVEHNEFYRRRISGYMARHICKPGITGLAQVDGWRGETAELESMVKRVEADLRYQREWSLFLDFEIFLRTLFSIRSPNAF
jgi:putative colanic acid biosynthesis UDP-glucose lipid carrier transferase